MKKSQPNYKRIYTDLIEAKFPDKKEQYISFLAKDNYSALEIINFNQLLFEKNDKDIFAFNQKHRSYDEATIRTILDYQKKNNMNNIELANHFNISKNSITKWKKYYK